jgi:cytochrome b involved in lipid metabolism
MNIKREITVGAIICFFILSFIFAKATSFSKNTFNPTASPVNKPGVTITLTKKEIAKHNTPSNCWLIISNKVYEVTSYIAAHPGGQSMLTRYCGADATGPYLNKGGQGSHSSTADKILGSLLLGNIGQSVVPKINPSKTVQFNNSNDYEDD